MKSLSVLVEAAGFVLVALGFWHVSATWGLFGSGAVAVLYAAVMPADFSVRQWVRQEVEVRRLWRERKAAMKAEADK